MEDDAVIETALHQRLDLRDMLRRRVGPQPDDDLAVFGRENDGVVRVLAAPRRTTRREEEAPARRDG